MKPTLSLLVVGMGSRYGGLKQLDGLGSNGETIMDYSTYDTIRTGFGKIVLVIREDFKDEFREKALSKYAGYIPAEVRFQSIGELPEGFTVSEGRGKSWDTNHAMVMVEELTDEPFCIINCDDFYNRDAFMVTGKFLANPPEDSKDSYAMVGLRVGNTLSKNGIAVRGICEKNERGNLATVVERIKIMRINRAVCYEDEQREWVTVDDNTPVLTNMRDSTPDYFKYSDAYFREFLSDPKSMESLKVEFFIPLMVNRLIQEGATIVKVPNTTSKWFGVTYVADRQDTVDGIQSLAGQDVYSNQLFWWMSFLNL